MNLKQLVTQIKSGETSSENLVQTSLDTIKKTENLNAYLSVNDEIALEKARAIDKRRSEGEELGTLAGIPLAVKDNIVSREGKTTCASRMLENFNSIYNATVVEKLNGADAVVVGKTNLDEFAMGSSTEFSAFGTTLNPLDNSVIPGGSSGGSAVAVATGSVPIALGSDTGGSIRQPAACCGVVGMKPTYGRVSRYGLVAFASSLDQIGPFARTVEDAAYLLNVVSGEDAHDQTSAPQPVPDFTASISKGVQGMTFGVPKECFGEGLAPCMKASIDKMITKLEKEGAVIKEVSMPHVDYGVSAYYIIATAEASSNLSRYDGVRYTIRPESVTDITSLYFKTRAEGFGKEVKRRIMLGTYVLSAGFYDAYYMQAQKVRRKITEDYNTAFKGCDIVLTPTMPELPEKLGEFENDPLKAYLGDIYTVGVNLAGLPGISVPLEQIGSLYTSLQLIGPAFSEETLFQAAAAVEQLSGITHT
ncbi:MAG: Asp-tRNA(Asn)/Glu-tRNA(Gln) amidotransferase subunit GatA [Fibrobacteria bacterium]|nr:Asp-tRNA(Asn)/Glu-tRNA(Gln) amidotransferase subunit GatA [Fibrobacteria bacterium]